MEKLNLKPKNREYLIAVMRATMYGNLDWIKAMWPENAEMPEDHILLLMANMECLQNSHCLTPWKRKAMQWLSDNGYNKS